MKKMIKDGMNGHYNLANVFMINRKVTNKETTDENTDDYREDYNTIYMRLESSNYNQRPQDYIKNYDVRGSGIAAEEIKITDSEYYSYLEGMPKIVNVREIPATESEDKEVLTVVYSDGTTKHYTYTPAIASKYNEVKASGKEIEHTEGAPKAKVESITQQFIKTYPRLLEVEYDDGKDGKKIKFLKSEFDQRIKQLIKDQKYIESEEYAKFKKRKIAKVLLIGGTGLLALMALWYFVKPKTKKDDNSNDVSPSYSPTIEATATPYYSPSPSPTATPSPTPSPSPTPAPTYGNGNDFLKELFDKEYRLTLNGDEIIFGDDEAENLFKLMDGRHSEVFAGMNDTQKRYEILAYQQVMLNFVSDTIDSATLGAVDITKYCKNVTPEQATLINTLFNKSRKITELSVNEPLNGQIIDLNDKTGKFSDEYIAAAQDFINTQKELLNIDSNPTYKGLSAWNKYLASYLAYITISRYVPEYFNQNYVEGSKEETKYSGSAMNVYFAYVDSTGYETRYLPIMTENGVRYESTTDGGRYTYEEMMAYTDKNSSKYIPALKTVTSEGVTETAVPSVGETNLLDTYSVMTAADAEVFAEEGLVVSKDPQYDPRGK